MKPHRIRMAHSLILHYGLHERLDVRVPRVLCVCCLCARACAAAACIAGT